MLVSSSKFIDTLYSLIINMIIYTIDSKQGIVVVIISLSFSDKFFNKYMKGIDIENPIKGLDEKKKKKKNNPKNIP